MMSLKMRFRLTAVALALLIVLAAHPASATIKYTVSLAHPEKHAFQVTMQIPNASRETTIALPAWNALYQIRDFSYRVRDVRVVAPNPTATHSLVKLDKQTWRITSPSGGAGAPASDELSVRYTIEWDETGPFSSQLNSHHAFLNFAEVLMYLPDRREEESVVSFQDVPDGWRSIGALPAGGSPNSFLASSYDKLVDAPVEVGKFEEFDFDNASAHFRVVVDSRDWNKGALEDSLKRITAYQLKLMGGPPFKEYTFIFHVGVYPEAGGGGMEHSNSTAIGASSLDAAIAISAHEFFHAWNVKRIRPQSLEPVDYTKERYSRALWFAEGVTSTYGSYTMERSGIWSKAQFYNDLAQQVCDLQARPAHTWQSVEESSLDTWFDKYDGYNLPDRSISYYNKGQIVGVMLDLAIRQATDNHKSLDDVLRRLNDEYAKQGKFYDDSAGIRTVVEQVSGENFDDFFRQYVSGTTEIPYDQFLLAAGLALKMELRKSADLGFYPGRSSAGIVVSAVTTGSGADAAGLRVGDVLLELNGMPVSGRLHAWLRERSPGEMVKLKVRREGSELEIAYAMGSREENRCSVTEVANAGDKQVRVRNGLLHGTAD